MAAIRRHHLLIAGVLFTIAVVLYAAGLRGGALACFVAGIVVELGAWIALLAGRGEERLPPGRH